MSTTTEALFPLLGSLLHFVLLTAEAQIRIFIHLLDHYSLFLPMHLDLSHVVCPSSFVISCFAAA